jgi:hypothetical protein
MSSNKRFRYALVIVSSLFIGGPTYAQTYNWLPWTFPTSQTASAAVPGLGSLNVSTLGASTSATPFTLRFDNVAFTPTIAPSAGVGSTPIQNWSFQIDLMSLSQTSGLILGLGNFGHGTTSYPGYRLSAVDRLGAAMPLSGFTAIGSYDHTWITPSWPFPFNDDMSLNTTTGVFNVTTTLGGDNNNSDILLLRLPADVGRLTVQTVAPSASDTINVVVAVPEATTVVLAGVAVVVGAGLIWPRSRKSWGTRGCSFSKADFRSKTLRLTFMSFYLSRFRRQSRMFRKREIGHETRRQGKAARQF